MWASALLPLGCAVLAACAPVAAPPPSGGEHPRVVSINPCVDALLMQVADAGQIVAISHFSHDPRATSIPIDQARRFRATSGTAEEVVALSPDLVLTGAHTAPATVQALRRMGIRQVEFAIPESVAESEAQAALIGRVVGHPDRGAALAGHIAAAAEPVRAVPVPALIWQGGGLVPGDGTLADDMLRRAGFANASAGYGLKQWDVLPLEYLVARPPRVLFSIGAAEAGGDRLMRHPALRQLSGRIAVEPYPARLLHCGGPTIVDAMRRLKSARRAVPG